MRRAFVRCVALSVLLSGVACAQSLGDIARENKEKKTTDGSAPAKVITNADLARDPDGSTDVETETAPTPVNKAANRANARRAASDRYAQQRAAEQWRQRIQAQEYTVANLQARVDRLRDATRYGGAVTSNDIAYSRSQARQLDRLNQLQMQLNAQKQKLADMQEAARHAGMHTKTYDP
jgi:hypothetical protein